MKQANQRGSSLILILVIVAILALAGIYLTITRENGRNGINTLNSPAPKANQNYEEQTISSNTQAQFGNDLRVGSGNFWEDEYVNSEGQTVKGLRAGLFIYPKDSGKEYKERVYQSQTLTIENYRITVLEVTDDSVKLRVEKQ